MNGYDTTLAEVHIIAYIYHWGRNEIMDLPIKVRRKYVQMIKQQKDVENSQYETSNAQNMTEV